MTPWTSYLPELRVMLPECPDVVMRAAVRDSASRFCEQSQCWQDTMDIPVMSSDRDIPLNTNDPGVEIVVPLWIGNADGNLEEKTPRWLDRNRSGWRYETGTPEFYTVPVRGTTLWLALHPDSTTLLEAQVVLKPSATATQGPDDLFADYRDGVQGGALARLALIPGKPWTNPGLAQIGEAKFLRDMHTASLRVARGNTRAAIRTTMNFRV